MRRISIVFAFLLLLLPGITAFAQDENIDTLKFEDIHEEKPPYFVVGGGFIGTFFFPKFDDINAQLINLGSNFKSPLFLAGGEGIVPTFILKNVRFGIWGMGGSKLIEKDTLISAANYKRGMNYSLGLTGISIDYGYVLFKSLAILPGVDVGFGSLSLESYQMGANYDWSSFGNHTDGMNFLNRADVSFISLEPKLNIEWAVTQFVVFRGAVGYPISFMGSWKFNRVSGLKNVPTSINGNGLTAQFGVFLGLFNY